MSKKPDTAEGVQIADELDRIQIEQLHRATLNFSSNSLETKKLCVTAEVAVCTLLAGIYKDNLQNFIRVAQLMGVLIPLLFYSVDVVLYFYQDRLRENMMKLENQIRKRHHLQLCCGSSSKAFSRLARSFFNGSQIMYFGLIMMAVVLRLLSR